MTTIGHTNVNATHKLEQIEMTLKRNIGYGI